MFDALSTGSRRVSCADTSETDQRQRSGLEKDHQHAGLAMGDDQIRMKCSQAFRNSGIETGSFLPVESMVTVCEVAICHRSTVEARW